MYPVPVQRRLRAGLEVIVRIRCCRSRIESVRDEIMGADDAIRGLGIEDDEQRSEHLADRGARGRQG